MAPTRTGLADRLRTATRAEHAHAERAGIMRDLLRGRLPCRTYALLLRNLHDVYAALEAALARHATRGAIAPLHDPALFRARAIAADLHLLHGERWREELRVQPVTAEYVARLAELADGRPDLLVAHAYTRYLGDLNGGQVLRRLVAAAFGLGAGAGTAFYEFGGADPGALARAYRAALDGLPVDEGTAGEIVAEAKRAFALHIRLFEALAGAPPAGAPAPAGLRGTA